MKRKELPDLIDQRAKRREKALLTGTVSKVWDKESDDINEGNIEVNVQTSGLDHEFRRVPMINVEHQGHVSVPQVGDAVVVDFMMGEGTQPVVIGQTPTNEVRSPNARPGHWRHEFRRDNGDDLYLEAVPETASDGGDPDILRLGLKADALAEPTTTVEVDDSGSSPTVAIKTDGDIEIDAGGDVLINNSNAGATPVAPADHTHTYEDTGDTDSGGGGSTQKTTSEPTESGTETQIG